jgi:hypothetical protein
MIRSTRIPAAASVSIVSAANLDVLQVMNAAEEAMAASPQALFFSETCFFSSSSFHDPELGHRPGE